MPEHIALTALCQQKIHRKLLIILFCYPHLKKKPHHSFFKVRCGFIFPAKIEKKLQLSLVKAVRLFHADHKNEN